MQISLFAWKTYSAVTYYSIFNSFLFVKLQHANFFASKLFQNLPISLIPALTQYFTSRSVISV